LTPFCIEPRLDAVIAEDLQCHLLRLIRLDLRPQIGHPLLATIEFFQQIAVGRVRSVGRNRHLAPFDLGLWLLRVEGSIE
jgi:hypothetical protein